MSVVAFSCRPAHEPWHIIVFTDDNRKVSRHLATVHDPSGETEYVDWRCRRFSQADGMGLEGEAWVTADDAPPEHREAAKAFWNEDWA